MTELIKMWMPILKSKGSESGFLGVLSDTSLDRDNELMHPDLIRAWAKNKSLPALTDHENKMGSYDADWINIRSMEQDGKTTLIADLDVFPTASGKELKIRLERGRHVGVSIGAIPQNSDEVEIEGKSFKRWTEAELVEASFTPIPSNRHARAMVIAKSLNLLEKDLITKPASVERCVEALKNDPKFKPKGGRTKEESAWAVCQAAHKKGFDTIQEFIKTSNGLELFDKYFEKLEVKSEMTNEKIEKQDEALNEKDAPEEPKESEPEAIEEAPKEEATAEPVEEKSEVAELKKEIELLKEQMKKKDECKEKKEAKAEVKKEINIPADNVEVEKEWSLKNLIKTNYEVKKK